MNSGNGNPSGSDLQRRHLALLDHATRGVYVSAAEQATLVWLAGQDTATVANLARLLNRARGARTVLARQPISLADIPASLTELPSALIPPGKTPSGPGRPQNTHRQDRGQAHAVSRAREKIR
jgi:hypothetical protein